ncbi:Signal peptide and transmembrane prediction [Planctomycetales bacterium 10988]|nr:Signal peptide and transmembrane prediction [Planctomycetales bacterium 10988]
MLQKVLFVLLLSCGVLTTSSAWSQVLTYEGEQGPGQGKHLVFLAGDHEYRSEETLPAIARILAKHHGFRCTVLFTVDPETGEIEPAADNMPGTEALNDADLMVIFLRFKNLPAEQMDPIVDYLEHGGPVVGLRTATHAFKIPADSPYARFDFQHEGDDYHLGFGREILGESWAGHYGTNHQMSTRLDINPSAKGHPILRGVKDMWVQAGGYWTEPEANSKVLATAQPLDGMTPDSLPAEEKQPCPGAWVRTYTAKSGGKGKVFTTTYGASEDILNEGFRRMLVNACFWAVGLKSKITPDLNVDLVGPYHPTTFKNGGHRLHVVPAELSDWNSPIMSPDKPIGQPKPRRRKKAS